MSSKQEGSLLIVHPFTPTLCALKAQNHLFHLPQPTTARNIQHYEIFL